MFSELIFTNCLVNASMNNNNDGSGYDERTINSTNVIAKYSHRIRMNNSLRYVVSRLEFGNVLDFGCGSGFLVSKLNQIKTGCAIGYEPFMTDRFSENLPIYADYTNIIENAPYATITIFEVLEHVQWTEMPDIFAKFKELLTPDGVVIVSVPIEIGPAVLLKEWNRVRNFGWKQRHRYKILELIGTVAFGIAGYREDPDAPFLDHKGFDFRELIRFVKSKGWSVKILRYSPLPIKCWFGNSQVFFEMKP